MYTFLLFQKTLKELFPTWEDVRKKYREVVIIMTGLLKDPRPLVDHTYMVYIKECRREMRTRDYSPPIDQQLFKSLYAESKVPLPGHPLHNQYINYYDHYDDSEKKRQLDTTAVYFPSKMYLFWRVGTDIECEFESASSDYQSVRNGRSQTTGANQGGPPLDKPMIRAPKYAIRVHWPDPEVTKHLLSVCRKISERQKLTDLCLKELDCKDLTAAEVPVISKKTQTMFLANHLR